MAKTIYVQVDSINIIPASLMMVPVYVNNMMSDFWDMMGLESISVFLNMIILLLMMLYVLFCTVVVIWYFALRFAEINILAMLGPVMVAFLPSSLDGIAKGWARRIFTTIIFGPFMIAGMIIFAVLLSAVADTLNVSAPLRLVFILALFANFGRLKGLISDLINERSNFDGSSWKNLPGALIVSRQANAMQKNYMKNRSSGGGNGTNTQASAKQSANTVKSGGSLNKASAVGGQMKSSLGTPLTKSSKL